MSESTLLHIAVTQGDVAKIQAWLKLGKPVDPRDGDGHTPLMLAARQAEGDAFRLLLDAGADPHAVNAKGMSPLFMAATQGVLSMVRVLIDKKADVNQAAEGGLTPLIGATIEGHAEIVRLLLHAGADPQAKDKDGRTVQHWAKKLGHKEVLAVLKEPDAKPGKKGPKREDLSRAARTGDVEQLRELLKVFHYDDKDAEGYTPLMLAAQASKRHACAFLLDFGASPFTEAPNGYNALLCAATNVEALRPFVAAGVNLNHQNKSRGVTPLMFAASQNFRDVVEFLLQAGVDVNLQDKNGMTALERAKRAGHRAIEALLKEKMPAQPAKIAPAKATDPKPKDETQARGRQLLKAARDGNLEQIQELLAQGTPLECRNREGYTPLIVAIENGHGEVFDLLLQAGADPLSRPPNCAVTPLYLACVKGQVDIVKALLARGAAVNTPMEGSEFTPLMGATLSGKLELVQLLVEAGADVNFATFGGESALTWARQGKQKAIVAYLKQQMGDPQPAPPLPVPATPVQPADPSKPMQVLRAAVQNFAITAAQPAYQKVIQMLEQLTGKPPKASAKRPGVYMLAFNSQGVVRLADRYGLPHPTDDEEREPVERILEKLLEEVRQQGFLLMVDSLWEPGQAIKLRLFPTADPYAVMASCGTNANNYGHTTRQVIAWFRKLAETHPFILMGCGHDYVAGRFTQPVADAKPLAKRMLAFCPDLSDGTASPGQIAKELARNPSFFFWWD